VKKWLSDKTNLRLFVFSHPRDASNKTRTVCCVTPLLRHRNIELHILCGKNSHLTEVLMVWHVIAPNQFYFILFSCLETKIMDGRHYIPEQLLDYRTIWRTPARSLKRPPDGYKTRLKQVIYWPNFVSRRRRRRPGRPLKRLLDGAERVHLLV
jgi:hypothetical protein